MEQSIYIAEDDRNIRELMDAFLKNDGFRTKTFSSGDELLAEFGQTPSDLVILDIMMPGTDGLSLCREIRSRSNVPIVIVSARDGEADRITGLTLGADDYLVKPFSPVELVVRVKALFRRLQLDRGAENDAVLRYGAMSIDTAAREAALFGARFEMTPTELALMAYLMQSAPRAVSREELLKNVWKFDFDVDTRATDDVVKRLRKKLAAAGADIRIESAWGYGFKLAKGEGGA